MQARCGRGAGEIRGDRTGGALYSQQRVNTRHAPSGLLSPVFTFGRPTCPLLPPSRTLRPRRGRGGSGAFAALAAIVGAAGGAWRGYRGAACTGEAQGVDAVEAGAHMRAEGGQVGAAAEHCEHLRRPGGPSAAFGRLMRPFAAC